MNTHQYEIEYEAFMKEVEEMFDVSNIPTHIFLMHKPVIGEEYKKAKIKMFFLGQDADKIDTSKDLLTNFDDKFNQLKNFNEWNDTFNFAEDENDNFLNWYYKNRYRFWEFPLRLINVVSGKGNVVLDRKTIDVDMIKQYSSFGWANLSPIVFPHIYHKRKVEYKLDLNTYSKIFVLAKKHFGNISFLNKYYEPDVVFILSAKFDYNDFFGDVKPLYEKEIHHKNKLKMYEVQIGNKKIKVITTYHPSGMQRLHNRWKDRFTIEQFVEETYKSVFLDK